MRQARKRRRQLWCASRQSWRTSWRGRGREPGGAHPCLVPWNSPICNHRLLFNKKRTYSLGNIDHSGLRIGRGLAWILGHEGPKLVKIHRWEVILVFLIVEMSLSLLSVVAWMTVYHKNILVSFCGKHAVLRQACPWKVSFTYYFIIMILSWCMPPALPRPPGCFLARPTLPLPMDTWPLILLVFLNLATFNTKERKSVSEPIFAETDLTHLPLFFADRFNNNHAYF